MLMTVDKCALLMIFFHGSFYLNCCHVKKMTQRRTHDVNTATIFLSRKLFLNYFTCPKLRDSYWGTQCSYWLSGASIDFGRFECVGLQQLLELLLRN